MMIQEKALIHAPVGVVWDVTVDIAHLPEATPTITQVEALDPLPLAVGGRARLRQPGLPVRVWTVTRLEPDRLFEWETTLMGVRMIGRHELRDVDGECENTLTVEFAGRGGALLGRLVRGRLAQAIATENAGFRRVAEARVAPGA